MPATLTIFTLVPWSAQPEHNKLDPSCCCAAQGTKASAAIVAVANIFLQKFRQFTQTLTEE
jgi:hypothetical protein